MTIECSVGVTTSEYVATVQCPNCNKPYGVGSFCVFIMVNNRYSILGKRTDCCTSEEIIVIFDSEKKAKQKSSEVLDGIKAHGSIKHLVLIPVETEALQTLQ